MSAAGAEIVDDVDLGALRGFGWDDELTVMLAEFPAGLAAYLATRSGGTAGSEPTLLELAAGLEATRDRTIGPLPPPR